MMIYGEIQRGVSAQAGKECQPNDLLSQFRLALADGIEVMKAELVGIDNTNP